MEKNEGNEIYIKQNMKLKDLFKYIQDGAPSQIFQDISPKKRKNILHQYTKDQKVKYEGEKNRYNDSLSKNQVKSRNYQNENDNYIDNNIEPEYNTEYNEDDNNIFTRIKPNLNQDAMMSYDTNKDIEYDAKTYNTNYLEQRNKNRIYTKSRTPTRKYTYYKKKKKKDSTNNTNTLSNYSESNNPINNSIIINNENNIYDSLNEEEYKTQIPEEYNKKMNKLIKYGLKFELNNENNNYIDLLTMTDIRNLENKFNLGKLPKTKTHLQNNKNINNKNNIYIKKNHNKGVINLKKKENKVLDEINHYKKTNQKNSLPKYINEDLNNKSYDCITFMKKIGMNKKRKKRNEYNAKSTDNIYNKSRMEKGTPIKKENDKGGKIVLYPKLYNKNTLNNKMYLININNKVIKNAAVIIQNWWKKYHPEFIKKITLIQRAFKEYMKKKSTQKILKKKTSLKKLVKENKDKTIYQNKTNINEKSDKHIINSNQNPEDDPNKIKKYNEEKIILLQNQFRNYIINKIKEESKLKNYYKYIPKSVCEISKKRLKNIIKKTKKEDYNMNKDKNKINNNYKITNIKSNNNNIIPIRNRNINNNNKENKDINNIKPVNKVQTNSTLINNKTHHYTKSKLSCSPLNKIIISQDMVRYETGHYTFLKKCHFRKRDDDDEDDDLTKASTTELMRKIDLNLKGKYRYLTPDNKNKNNPCWEIDYLEQNGNIQILSNKNKKKINTKKNNNIKVNNNNFNNYGLKISKYTNKVNNNKKTGQNNYNNRRINNNIHIIKSNNNNLKLEKEKNNDIKINGNNIDNLVQTVTIPYQLITKCKMDEIVINKNKNKNQINYKEKEDVDKYKKLFITKIILIQKNIRIFIEKIRIKKRKKENKLEPDKKDSNIYIKKVKVPNYEKTHNFQDSSYLNNKTNHNEKLNKIQLDNNKIYNKKNENYSENQKLLDNDKIYKPKSINTESFIKTNINKESLVNKLPNKGETYASKMRGRANTTTKIINHNNIIKNTIISEIKENDNIDVNNIRNSCPLKVVKKFNYKVFTKDYVENILKDNEFDFTSNQLKEIEMQHKYFKLDYIMKMLVQKIQKVNKQYTFLRIKGEGFSKFVNIYFNIIKVYLNNKNLYINDKDEVSILLKEILPFYSNFYEKYKFIPYINSNDEEKLINTELFRKGNNYKGFISFICKYLKLQKNTTNFSEELIKYHLIKYPLKNFNIFGITRYIDYLYHVMLYSNVDIKELKKNIELNLDYEEIIDDDKINKFIYSEHDKCIEMDNDKSDINNLLYRKTMNFKKPKITSLKRHIMNSDSSDINDSYEKIQQANNSLIKKSIIN